MKIDRDSEVLVRVKGLKKAKKSKSVDFENKFPENMTLKLNGQQLG